MSKFTLADLEKRVHERAKASAKDSYTRALIDKGVAHCAKKLGEEAVETAIAAVSEDREHLIAESADLIYHLMVLLEARGIKLAVAISTLVVSIFYLIPQMVGAGTLITPLLGLPSESSAL